MQVKDSSILFRRYILHSKQYWMKPDHAFIRERSKMHNEINLKDIDLAGFEEKVYTIADEVLNILKELSHENKKQISSELIAEKMCRRESVKSALKPDISNSAAGEIEYLKDITNIVLDKFTELVPPHMSGNFSILKDTFGTTNPNASTEWLDSPISIIKKYINSLSTRNSEVESFLKQTMQHLDAIEGPLSGQLSSHQNKIKADRSFEEDMFRYMDTMKDDCHTFNDINTLKAAFLGKIENISKGLEIKREEDMLRMKETEKTLIEMGKRMHDIKRDADEVRKKSKEAEFEAYHDALTGLFNRRAYQDRVDETITNLQRYKVPASLMICDIDFFKKINDAHGHKVGDLALKKLAGLLVERLRKNDVISRYGGEEFAVILPHTDLAGAVIAGEGIRSYIAKSVFSYKGQSIPLTISVGISAFKTDDTPDTVFERADHALYLAKKSGRNIIKSETDLMSDTVLSKNVS